MNLHFLNMMLCKLMLFFSKNLYNLLGLSLILINRIPVSISYLYQPYPYNLSALFLWLFTMCPDPRVFFDQCVCMCVCVCVCVCVWSDMVVTAFITFWFSIKKSKLEGIRAYWFSLDFDISKVIINIYKRFFLFWSRSIMHTFFDLLMYIKFWYVCYQLIFGQSLFLKLFLCHHFSYWIH